MFLASRLAVSAGAFGVYAKGLVRSVSTLFKAPQKVLCTDLDNTFSGGSSARIDRWDSYWKCVPGKCLSGVSEVS